MEKIHDVKVLSFSPDKIELEIAISVKNPNSYQLKLNQLNIDLLNIDRDRIGMAELSKAVEIPKKRSAALHFKVSLESRPTVRMINKSDSRVFFYVSGKGEGRVLCSNKKFDFEEPVELDLRKHLEDMIPRFEAEGAGLFQIKRSYVDKLGIAETKIKIDFILLNPYGFTFRLKEFPAEIFINDKPAGTGNLANQLNFDENIFSREESMQFKVNNWKSIIGAVKGAVKGEITYRVRGMLIIDAYGIEIRKPYTYEGSVPVSLSDYLLN
ncbi:MAG: hypothetical protein Q8M98_01110 [Candidatus Cloacimonadaceae bacterium]|nr:hypothetical protein [Candidatus Cloacimonadaceae bacterium]